MTIEGRVADVINKYTVVVNLGSADGVKETHRYGIYSESDPIEDPETGEELGTMEYKLAEVKPTKIDEKKSKMKSDEMVGGVNLDFANPFKPRTKELTDSPEFKHGDSNVKLGDKVKFLRDLDENDDG